MVICILYKIPQKTVFLVGLFSKSPHPQILNKNKYKNCSNCVFMIFTVKKSIVICFWWKNRKDDKSIKRRQKSAVISQHPCKVFAAWKLNRYWVNRERRAKISTSILLKLYKAICLVWKYSLAIATQITISSSFWSLVYQNRLFLIYPYYLLK